MHKRIFGIILLMSFLVAMGISAQAKFPTKPIKIIVPWNAGGGT